MISMIHLHCAMRKHPCIETIVANCIFERAGLYGQLFTKRMRLQEQLRACVYGQLKIKIVCVVFWHVKMVFLCIVMNLSYSIDKNYIFHYNNKIKCYIIMDFDLISTGTNTGKSIRSACIANMIFKNTIRQPRHSEAYFINYNDVGIISVGFVGVSVYLQR